GLVGVLIGSGLVVGFIDLLRPADQRTHVGRFFEKVGSEGFSGFSTVLQRKGGENVSTIGATTSAIVIAAVIVSIVLLWARAPRALEAATAAVPTLRAAVIPLVVLGALEYALNDSGIAVPAIMLSVVAATIAYLAADAVGRIAVDSSSGAR